ncbi:unnamed protein product [Schistosoma mattheei]|uniref:Uncharacterized protein n=1 Tax=Schistosoma mattheei TaxID=31246 RepID=A0A183PG36_9TREM|nr:unnamed protein product [Schistosoma mattheei]
MGRWYKIRSRDGDRHMRRTTERRTEAMAWDRRIDWAVRILKRWFWWAWVTKLKNTSSNELIT